LNSGAKRTEKTEQVPWLVPTGSHKDVFHFVEEDVAVEALRCHEADLLFLVFAGLSFLTSHSGGALLAVEERNKSGYEVT
jgi:hypothetical protein